MPLFFDDLDPDIRAILLAQIRNLWTHTSTAIEGNTLSLGDTAFLLDEGLTVSGKPLKDHQEVVGHARAIEIVYELINRGAGAEAVVDEDLFTLHRAIQAEVVLDIYQPVGKWKNEPNFTTFIGLDGKQQWREYPKPKNIPKLMNEWLALLNQPLSPESMTPSRLADHYADLHLSFVTIHPFFDGNGRMARLLANVPILRMGYPPIVIPTECRKQYKEVLSGYQEQIPDLSDLRSIQDLPDNEKKMEFRQLCHNFWKSTIDLVTQARIMQDKRRKESIQDQ